MLLTFFVDSLSNSLFIVTICVPKRNEKIICVDYQTFMFFLCQKYIVWKMRKVCGNIPQKVGECKVPNHVIIGKL